MAKKAAETGSGPAVGVAIEQHFPEGTRLIDDDLAGRILPAGMRFWVWLTRASWMRDWMIGMAEKKTPGAWAIFPCRKRYIEKSWLFGIDPEDVADFLGGYGWRVLEHVGYEELAERYVKPTGRQLESLPIERVVYAEKM